MNVPPDYDRDRKNQTFTEVHGISEKAQKRRDTNRNQRRLNRQPGRFFKSNWAAYKHYELYDMIHSANVGDMSTRAGEWKALAGKIEATTGDVQRVVDRVLGSWHGAAAVRSAESNTRLMSWADEVSHTTSQVAAGMSDYTDAIAKAQQEMPEPGFTTAEENFRNGYSIGTHGEPSTAVLLKALTSDGIVSHQESQARETKAVQVMQNYENQSEGVHDTMPHLPDSPAGPQEQPTWTPGPSDDPGPGPGPGPGPVPPGPAPGPDGGSEVPGTTTAAGYADPARAGAGGPGSPGGPGGLSGTGYGGGVGSLGAGGGDMARGGSGPGGLAGIGGMAGRPAGAAGVLGARGAGGPGAFGGMPMGAGAPGEEDKEHKNKYDEGLDLFDDLPPAYPPVFGA